MMNFGASKENHLIMKRRAEESRRAYYNQIAQADAKGKFLSKWENTTTNKIQHKEVDQEIKRLKRVAKRELEDRRDRLAEKLSSEDAAYRQELIDIQETPDQRRNKIIAKAKALKERREKRSEELAQEQLYRKFVRDCDELREAKSRAKVLDYMKFRSAQMKEKKEQDEHERKIDEYYQQQWAASAERKREREAREAREAERKKANLNRFLEEQIEEQDIAKTQERKRQEAEDQRLRELWDMEQQKADSDAAERVRKAQMIQDETNEYNRRKQLIREEDAKREKELDDKLLAQVLEEEAKQKEAEEAHRLKLKAQAKRYQELLKEQMKKEAKDESDLEAARQKEIERQWKKKQDRWDREQAARDKLMEEVMRSREEQIAEKKLRDRARREAEEADRFRLAEQLRKREQLEAQEAMEKKKLDHEHQEFLKRQMESKQQTRDAIFQMQRAQQKAEIEARQAYERALKRELEKLEQNKPAGYKHIPIAKKY